MELITLTIHLVLPPTRENGDGEANEIIKIIN